MAISPEERAALALAAVAEARGLRSLGEEMRADEVIRHAVHSGARATDMMDAIEAAALADGLSNPGLAP